MLRNHRSFVTRVFAVALILALLLSCTAAFAASFSASKAGIKYKGASWKVGKSYSSSKLKSAFGKPKMYDGCTCGYASYEYRRSGLFVETLQKKKGGTQKIITIRVTSKSISTLAGVRVGKKYGNGSKRTYSYSSGGCRMKVKTNASKKVTSIQFTK